MIVLRDLYKTLLRLGLIFGHDRVGQKKSTGIDTTISSAMF